MGAYLLGVLIMFILYRIVRYFDKSELDWNGIILFYALILCSWAGLILAIAALLVVGALEIIRVLGEKDPPKWL